MAVQTVLARLAADGLPALAGKRVGLICNPTSVDAELRHAVEVLRGFVNLVALFGPDHSGQLLHASAQRTADVLSGVRTSRS